MSSMKCLAYRYGILVILLLMAHQQAQAQPHVGKLVREITVEGASIYTNDHILSQLQTRAGQPFSQITAQEDVQRLYKKGWFKNVSIDTKLFGEDKVDVIISVEELRTRIEKIEYRGVQHLGIDEIKKITGLREGMPMSPVANRAAAQALLRKYLELGRLNASVRILEGEKEDDTRVVFEVVEGRPVKINDIRFEFFGATSGEVSKGRLREQINSSRPVLGGLTGGKYDPVQVEFDVVRVKDYYKSLGYLDIRADRELIWAADHRTVDVVFHVEEGPR